VIRIVYELDDISRGENRIMITKGISDPLSLTLAYIKEISLPLISKATYNIVEIDLRFVSAGRWEEFRWLMESSIWLNWFHSKFDLLKSQLDLMSGYFIKINEISGNSVIPIN